MTVPSVDVCRSLSLLVPLQRPQERYLRLRHLTLVGIQDTEIVDSAQYARGAEISRGGPQQYFLARRSPKNGFR